MKPLLFFTSVLCFFLSCQSGSDRNSGENTSDSAGNSRTENAAFGKLLDAEGMDGTILVYDPEKDHWYSNDFKRAERGYIPASTFKIPNSIIGLETGVISSEHHMFRWDGKPQWQKAWEKDMDLPEAFKVSCVPCYRELARKVGRKRMEDWLQKLNFGDMVVDSLDMFWLAGKSRISCFEQTDFLKRLNENKLAIKPATRDLLRKIMLTDSSASYKLYGKTGWGDQDSLAVLWFNGFVETAGKTYYVCLNATPKIGIDPATVTDKRKTLCVQALKEIGFIR